MISPSASEASFEGTMWVEEAPSGSSGRGFRGGSCPCCRLAQYPRGGVGTCNLSQIFRNPTSEKPYSSGERQPSGASQKPARTACLNGPPCIDILYSNDCRLPRVTGRAPTTWVGMCWEDEGRDRTPQQGFPRGEAHRRVLSTSPSASSHSFRRRPRAALLRGFRKGGCTVFGGRG